MKIESYHYSEQHDEVEIIIEGERFTFSWDRYQSIVTSLVEFFNQTRSDKIEKNRKLILSIRQMLFSLVPETNLTEIQCLNREIERLKDENDGLSVDLNSV